MNQNPPEFWLQSAEQLQQSFASNWTTAMQSVLGALPEQFRPAAGAMPGEMPRLVFAPAKLQELQQQYLQ